MKIAEKGNTIMFIKKSDELIAFVDQIKDQWRLTEDKSVIIDLSSEPEVRPAHLIPFEPLAAEQKSKKKSFVIIASIEFDEVADDIMVVPTLQEANDYIESEETERGLDF